MSKSKKYEPIKINADSPDDLYDVYRRDISKAIINAIKYSYSKRMKSIDFAEVNFGNKLFINLAIDAREYEELINKNIQILEEFEEYELCADALEIKNKIKSKNNILKN